MTPECLEEGGNEFSEKEEMGSHIEGDPTPLNFLLPRQPSALDWVLRVGSTIYAFIDNER